MGDFSKPSGEELKKIWDAIAMPWSNEIWPKGKTEGIQMDSVAGEGERVDSPGSEIRRI
jgi:hypothetical protein